MSKSISSGLRLETLESREVFNAVNPLSAAFVGPLPPDGSDATVATTTPSSHGPNCQCGPCQRLVDLAGNVAYAMPPAPKTVENSPSFGDEIPPFPETDTFTLHSLPGATKVIYLDFNGHTSTNTAWNSSYGNVVTPGFNFEGTADTYTTNEHERIQRIWQSVAEDFIMFGVDVTTEDPGVEALQNTGGGDTRWGKRVCIGGRYEDWFGSPAGGVAYLNSFVWSVDTPCFVFADTQGNVVKYIADAVSHEVGHTFGLNHDGTSSLGYYQGHHGANSPGWAPIMGVGYYQPIVQWSKGEYTDANNHEDDVAIIANNTNGVGFRADEAGATIGTAASMSITGSAASFNGIITQQSDVDVLKFGSGIGNISFNLTPYVEDPNVDILAELLDSNGNVLTSNNPSTSAVSSMSASINYTITTAGTYYLRVSGSGSGDLATGYSNYGSIGRYFVTGTVVGAPVINNLETSTVTFTEDGGPVSMTSQITLSDDGQLGGAVISITGFQPEDRLTFTPIGSIVGTYDANTGKLTLSGVDTLARYQTALRSVKYDNTLANPIDGSRTVKFQITDDVGNMSTVVSRPLSIISVNDAPTLNAISPVNINEDASPGTINLAGIGAGGGESQTLTITATSDNTALIPNPTVNYTSANSTGSLGYTVTGNISGTATITVTVTDDGGTANGGTNVFVRQFVITVNPVNDMPTFNIPTELYVVKNAAPVTLAGFATSLNTGAPDEAGQTLAFDLVADNPSLFSVQPAISADGTLTFTAANGSIGNANVTVTMRDNGGTAYGGVDRSSKSFVIIIGENRAPVLDNSGSPRVDYVASNSVNPPASSVGAFGALGVSDVDAGTVLGGIAVIDADSGNGVWKFSIDAGATWNNLGAVSASSARLLREIDLLKFFPNTGFIGTSSITYRAWDQSSGNAGDLIDLSTSNAVGTKTPFSTATETADLRVAPVIATQLEDAVTQGRKVDTWQGVTIADADAGAKRGVAIIGSGGNVKGRWEFRIGTAWVRMVGMSPTDATLLRSTDSVRFIADANQSGEAYLLFRAWDQSSGAAGSRIDTTSVLGGANPFSAGSDAFFFRVTPVNDFPVIDSAASATLATVAPTDSNPTGSLVSKILGATVTDFDPGTVPGLAVTTYGKTGGTWQYQLASGGGWKNFPTVSATSGLLLGPTDMVRFIPAGVIGNSTLTFKAWDRTSGIAGANANTNLGDAFSKTLGKAVVNIATITGSTTNSAPTLTSLSRTFTPMLEDSITAGDMVSLLLESAFSDADSSLMKGIAVTSLTGADGGAWQYSLNGTTWIAIGQVSSERALLLRDSDKIRFLPNANYNGTATLSYHAWDRTRGTAGQYANLALTGNSGGTSPFGSNEATASITVTPVNDAPVLNITPVPIFHQVDPGDTNSEGDPISLLLGNSLTDVDANSSRGIAITNASSTTGSWQYRLAGSSSWATVPVLPKLQVFFLRETDRLRFVPLAGFTGAVTLTYRGWDTTSGVAGQTGAVASAGTSLSAATETASLTVGVANARPILNVRTNLELPAIGVNSSSSGGMQISALLGSSAFDPNRGTALGIAVVANDNTNGIWEFSESGAQWFQFGDTTTANAVVLKSTYFVRFVPNAGFTGATSIQFKAWDGSDMSLGGNAVDSRTSTAFSTAIQTAKLTVNTAPTLTIP